ncbi:MAG: SufD family Fe-S cluster assembly protein [Myxococcaceae bacterium]|nr:SufD family Fe-S cluster assembly protein [Myxococcaceae bacterium]MBH2006170.1 SufD family Fe-S cluster assembly protein [Myxococcaceae bacterium]
MIQRIEKDQTEQRVVLLENHAEQVFELEAHSHLNYTCLSLAQKDLRHSIRVLFLGEHASCTIKILDFAKYNSKLESTIHVIHQVSNCSSSVLHKGLYRDASQGSFHAQVNVGAKTMGSEAVQMHRSLLLSPDARCQADPHLVIQTDSVKCKHGVTVGQLDDKALFYLQARGLSILEAQRLLIQAFSNEIIGQFPEFQKRVEAWI